jgi:hypothetical protein
MRRPPRGWLVVKRFKGFETMKFNVAVLAVLATTLAGAPLISMAADSGSTPTTSSSSKAKHTHHKAGSKKGSKKSSSSGSDSAPK